MNSDNKTACTFSGKREKRMPVGGQAVIEGVLMRGPQRWGLAVRQQNGEIVREHWDAVLRTSSFWWKCPMIRGLVIMFEMLKIGIRALNRSAEIALGDEETITPLEFAGSVAFALIAVIGVFVALPVWLAHLGGEFWSLSETWKNVFEGLLRGTFFVLYVAGIGLWKEIRDVFRYHGAEHKTINAFEAGVDMTPENVMNYSRIHPRCGTSFLLIVVIVSIIVFSIAGHGSLLWKIMMRVLLLPVVVGISYEIIRAASSIQKLGRIILWPALSFQYLTTREPSIEQVEVALAALEEALDRPLYDRSGGEEYNEFGE
ncbi:MAG: DUF1385 domain-containing protein [Aminobacterium colombiense]|uniref:DUF1385 domain-containing protein n=1 Tax=Aminobacterium colombiense (strain DSM 12261 / ALA-1) TaxID=572547 RepID=D5EE75_AMICL|nr:DUF1385 domain-containing protein [Aminobacterium colombiense]ADE56857.1 protein of unknown function DUF1385 [Aminobacterium colombiense DSM 12261]MDD4266284.1 DUF1385 domain-containing protein [Aminobacterium colombiense]MDD4585421.1 DUF1385 domain-containing protein [Aminobacterium colombiense]